MASQWTAGTSPEEPAGWARPPWHSARLGELRPGRAAAGRGPAGALGNGILARLRRGTRAGPGRDSAGPAVVESQRGPDRPTLCHAASDRALARAGAGGASRTVRVRAG